MTGRSWLFLQRGKRMKNNRNIIDLESHLINGRLTESSHKEKYEWRKMIEEIEGKGRPLTENELERFQIKSTEIE